MKACIPPIQQVHHISVGVGEMNPPVWFKKGTLNQNVLDGDWITTVSTLWLCRPSHVVGMGQSTMANSKAAQSPLPFSVIAESVWEQFYGVCYGT